MEFPEVDSFMRLTWINSSLAIMSHNVKVTDVLRLQIRVCVARPATAKCGGEKPHKVFVEGIPNTVDKEEKAA
jgi:hypothetical protein